jgi:hypothetical protein
MPESLQLLSKQREEELRHAAEARELQAVQQAWTALADEYHEEIRKAAAAVGRKNIATDLGNDLSTVSNWLSCEPGRGFPPPKLLLYLRRKVPALSAWEREHAETAIDDGQAFAEIERDFLPELGKRDADRLRAILRRRKPSVRP